MTLRVVALAALACFCAITALALTGAARASTAPAACVEGTPEPSGSNLVRPTQRAICNYSATEFHRRLFRLIAARNGSLGIETVERQFDLPRVTTAFDSVRTANYSIIIESAPGGDTWSAMITVGESFGPDIESRPARFRGTLRPVRINPRERGDLAIGIALLRPTQPGQSFCLTTAALDAAARRAGWQDAGQSIAMDSAMVTVLLERRGLSLSYTPAECIYRVDLDQDGDPPTVPITPQETEALRHAAADRLAAEIEQRLAAQAAPNDDDAEARRAWARSVSDGYRNDYRSPEALEPTIEAMSVEQLRDLARRAVVGHYWGAWGEHCLAAIQEGDIHTGLARRTQAQGWNAAELQALESACSIYLQGRVYRYRQRPANSTPVNP